VDLRHSFGESEPLERLLAESGFSDVRVETLSDTARFDDGPVFARLNTMALVGMSAAGKSMSDDERARVVTAIVADSQAVLQRYAAGNGVAFEILSNVATGRG